MSRYKAYPAYRDSGVEWLGEIPSQWEISPLKYLATFTGGGTPSKENPDFWNGNIPWVSPKDMKTPRISTTIDNITDSAIRQSSTNLLEKGALLMVVRSGILQHSIPVAINDVPISLNQDMKALRFAAPLLSEYAFYFVIGNQSSLLLEWSKEGATVESIEHEFLANTPFPCPPLSERTAIIAFLDHETAKIDALIEKQQRLIELLKEKRQAVISHAVTKGLNPNAPMKDSGVEWLGEIPAHWDLTRLGWICSEINDINHVMPAAVENGIPFLSAKDLLDDGTLNFTNDIKMISEDDFANLSKKICPRRGDIIYSRIGACLGKARLVETDVRFLISYSCCVVRVTPERASRRFIQHLLDGEMILTEARIRTQGIGVPDLGLGEIGRFPVPLPPIAEQERIADYLDRRETQLSCLAAEAQRAVVLLQERRTALISAAVTGKIDVRDWQPAAA